MMTKGEAISAIAQGVINITEGLTTIEEGSRVFEGMRAIVLLLARPESRQDMAETWNRFEPENDE